MNEGLITEIVRQILTDPVLSRKFMEMGLFEKPKLLVLSESPLHDHAVWKRLGETWGGSYSLYCLGTPQSSCPEGIVSVTEAEAGSLNWERMIVPDCSVSAFVRISLGLCDDLISKFVSTALLKGIPVEIAEPDFHFTPNTPQAYQNLYKGYAEQLRSFGAVITNSLWNQSCPKQDLADKMITNTGPASKTEEMVHYEKKLLSEKDALALSPNCTLRITKRTVISPLAKDVLKMRNIQLDLNGEAFSCF